MALPGAWHASVAEVSRSQAATLPCKRRHGLLGPPTRPGCPRRRLSGAAARAEEAAAQAGGGATAAPQDAGITMRSGEMFSLDDDDSHVYVDARERAA